MSIKLADLFDEIERRGLSVAQFARQTGIPEDRSSGLGLCFTFTDWLTVYSGFIAHIALFAG